MKNLMVLGFFLFAIVAANANCDADDCDERQEEQRPAHLEKPFVIFERKHVKKDGTSTVTKYVSRGSLKGLKVDPLKQAIEKIEDNDDSKASEKPKENEENKDSNDSKKNASESSDSSSKSSSSSSSSSGSEDSDNDDKQNRLPHITFVVSNLINPKMLTMNKPQ